MKLLKKTKQISKAKEFARLFSPENKIGIVAALPEEAKCISTKRLKRLQPTPLNDHILLCRSGIGFDHAREAANRLIAFGAKTLISFGTAGALRANLKTGDLIVPRTILSVDGQRYDCHDDIRSLFIRNLTITPSIRLIETPILHSSDILTGMDAKRAAFEKYDTNAVDMESLAIAQIAVEHEIPFLITRVILDELTMELPKMIVQATNSRGEISYLKFLLHLLLTPSSLKQCLELRRRLLLAQDTLRLIGNSIKNLAEGLALMNPNTQMNE